MCSRHFRGIMVVTTFALILVVAYQLPAAADCAAPPGPRGCPGDVDGDGDTDLTDLAIHLAARGSQPGDPNWDPRADLDGDGDIG